MRRMLLRSMLVGLGLFAAGAARGEGVNLSWGDCGVNGSSMQTFACDQNSGVPFTLVGSFTPPSGIDEYVGMSAQVDICTMTESFVDWWAHGAGRCRATGALATDFNFNSGPFSCADFFTGQAAGGYAYDVSFGNPDRARLRMQAAVPIDNKGPVDSGMEYYAFKVTINRTKSTGTGSCAGCERPACIILNSIQLFQPPEAGNDPQLSAPINSNFVNWQGLVPWCPFVVPMRNTSWGQIKSLFR